jgi:hypothetical protein
VTLRQNGRTHAMGTVTFMLPDVDKAGSYLGAPLPEEWRPLFMEK